LLYDRGLHGRGAAVSPALLVVARDPASEARFGAGPWDRAVLARLVVGLNRAGAAAIGVDIPLGPPSAPGRGGASSDALLSQATVLAGNVVYPITLDLHPLKTDLVPALSPSEAHPSWPLLPRVPLALPRAEAGAPLPGLARQARAVGHTRAPADPDGVVRRVPLFVQLGDRAVPAFGFAVATVVAGVSPDQIVVERGSITVGRWGRIPVDDRERALVGWVAPRRLTVVPFLDLWTAVEERRAEALRTLVEDKIVLVLTEPARGVHRTPVGSVSDGEIQAQVLNAVLTGSWLREAPLGWTLGATLVIAALTAWLGLYSPGGRRWSVSPSCRPATPALCCCRRR